MRGLLIAVAVLALGAAPSHGGAWTLDRGKVLVISGVTISGAGKRYDSTSRPAEPAVFRKFLTQNWMEYGLTDAVTLFVAPEYVSAAAGNGQGKVFTARDAAMEAGARVLLLSRVGMLAIQGSAKTAGAFDMSVSSGQASGSQMELRLLYGRPFRVLGKDGYADFEVAERWIRHPRPNEMTVDASLGLRLRPATLVMLQSFNTISGGGGEPPYHYYRIHKLELSVVEQTTAHWSLQVGAFISPAGQNMIVEEGLCLALWTRF